MTNTATRVVLISFALAATGALAAPMIYARMPFATGQSNPLLQPVQFDHRHHVRDDGIDCRYCHGAAEHAPYAGVPATEVCSGFVAPRSMRASPVARSARPIAAMRRSTARTAHALNLPPQSSSIARSIDHLHFAVILCMIAGALVAALFGAMFLVRYRRRTKTIPLTPYVVAPRWLEGLVIGGLLALFCALWVVGFSQYRTIVWVILAVLATLSLLASYAPLGDWNVIVAFAIATIKAALVFGFFMHLLHGPPLHRIVIAVAICFVVLIMLGVLADVATRSVASSYVDGVRS